MSDRTDRQLRTASNGLVIYGIVGIVLTVALLGISFAIGSRLESLSDRLTGRLDTISQTIDKTATTLERASTTSGSVTSTIQQGVTTIDKVDATLGEVVGALRGLQTAASTLSIFGQTPLSSISDQFGKIANQLEALKGQVDTLTGNLGNNQSTLGALGASMTDLVAQLHQVSDVLRSGDIEDSLREIVSIIRWSLSLLAIWFAVPAIVALAFGIWIRRQLRPDGTQATGGAAATG